MIVAGVTIKTKKGKLMKRLALIFTSMCLVSSASAIELVCKGEKSKLPNQKIVFVDCKDRKDIIDMLEASWMEIRRRGFGKELEQRCFDPYQNAKKMNPNVSLEGSLVNQYFYFCNMALQHIK